MRYRILRAACQAAFPLWTPGWPNIWLNAAAASWRAPPRFLDSIAEPTRSVKLNTRTCFYSSFPCILLVKLVCPGGQKVKRTVVPFSSYWFSFYILKCVCFQNGCTVFDVLNPTCLSLTWSLRIPLCSIYKQVNFIFSFSVLDTKHFFVSMFCLRNVSFSNRKLQHEPQPTWTTPYGLCINWCQTQQDSSRPRRHTTGCELRCRNARRSKLARAHICTDDEARPRVWEPRCVVLCCVFTFLTLCG